MPAALVARQAATAPARLLAACAGVAPAAAGGDGGPLPEMASAAGGRESRIIETELRHEVEQSYLSVRVGGWADCGPGWRGSRRAFGDCSQAGEPAPCLSPLPLRWPARATPTATNPPPRSGPGRSTRCQSS
jgi:hypothetical protein